MKKFYIIIVTIFSSYAAFAQTTTTQWSQTIGGFGSDIVRSVAVDDAGNVYLAGSFAEDVDFDPSVGGDATKSVTGFTTDAFIAKYNSSGAFQWVVTFGDEDADEVLSIAVNTTGVYATGYVSGTVQFDPNGIALPQSTNDDSTDAFLAKYTSAGVLSFAHVFGSPDTDYGESVAIDASSNVYMAGAFNGDINLDPAGASANLISTWGGLDAFLVKYNSSGTYAWSVDIGSTLDDVAFAVTTVGTDVWIGGRYKDELHPDPTDSDTEISNDGGNDGFFAQYTNAGVFEWIGSIQSDDDDAVLSLAADGSGGVYAGGYFNNTATIYGDQSSMLTATSNGFQDAFVARFDATTRVVQWINGFGSSDDDYVGTLACDAGTVYATGGYLETIDLDPSTGVVQVTNTSGTYDGFLVRYDHSDGAYISHFIVAEADGGDEGLAVAAKNGNLYWSGVFQDDADIDPNATVNDASSQGDYDIFFNKFIPSEPTSSASGITFNNVTATSFGVTIVSAVDPEGFLTIIKAGNAPTGAPVDGTTYNAQDVLGDGTVLFVGSSHTISVTSASPATTYYLAVYPYNGAGSGINYRTTSPATSNVLTLTPATEPSDSPSGFSATVITSSSYTVSYTTPVGPAVAGYLVVRTAGAQPTTDPADGITYALGSPLGNGTIAYVGTSTSFNESGLTTSTQYFYKIYAYNGTTGTVNYKTTLPLTGDVTTLAPSEPSNSPTAFSASAITNTSYTVSYTAPAGPVVAGYIAIRSAGAAPTTDPVDGTTYTIGGSLGNGVVNYVGSEVSFNESSLLMATHYYYKIYAYNGSASTIDYKVTSPLAGDVTTTGAVEPTAQPTNLTFANITTTSYDYNFTASASANVAGYLIVRRTSVAPTFVPADGTVYAQNTVNSDGSKIAISGTGTSYDLTGAIEDTEYFYEIFAFNGTDTDINYLQTSPLRGNVTTLNPDDDATPPVITDNTPATVAPSASLKVSVTVTDNLSGVDEVTIEYYPINSVRKGTGTLALKAGTTNVYEYTIDASFNTEQGIEYNVVATDLAGNSTSDAWKSVLVTFTDDGLAIPYTAGTAQENYRIISVPLNLTKKTVADVFADDLGDYDKTKYRLFHFSGNSTAELTATSTIDVGKGYWFIASDQKTVDTGAGITATVGIERPFTIPITNGWNQIGNPFDFNVDWTQVTGDDDNSDKNIGAFKIYEGKFSNATSMKKMSGGFVMIQSSGNGQLKIPVDVDARLSAPTSPANFAQTLESDTWAVDLIVSSGDQENTFSGFGMHPDANDQNDKYDDFTLPRFVDYLELNYNKKLFGSAFTKDIVPTSAEHVWEFEVASNSTSETITLQWDNSYFGSSNVQLVLWDVEQQRAIDMKNETSYVFERNQSGSFKIFFGNDSFVKSETLPYKPVFHSASPVPSSGNVTFAFSVPESNGQNTNLAVYNLMGQKMANLVDRTLNAGYQQAVWNIEDGTKPAAGVYISVLKFGDTILQKRLVIK